MPKTPTRLKDERLRLGLDQTGLARLSGVSQAQISVYESGGAFPRPENIEKLAVAFGVQPETMFRWLLEPAKGEDAA